MDEPVPTRDDKGRYQAGNPGGPGRPRSVRTRLQHAAEDAITPDHVNAMMRKALVLALQGNLGAIRLVLERVCGRPPDATAEAAITVTMPNLRTPSACAAAIDRLVEAVSAGTIDLSAAKVMLDLVQSRMKAIELNDMETRLAELEKQAATVDFGRRA